MRFCAECAESYVWLMKKTFKLSIPVPAQIEDMRKQNKLQIHDASECGYYPTLYIY